jgi:hypothetical protein
MKLALRNGSYDWIPLIKGTNTINNKSPFYHRYKSDIHIFYVTLCDINNIYHDTDFYMKEIQFYASCHPSSLQKLTRYGKCKICSKLTFYICILPSSKIIRICPLCTYIKTKSMILGENILFYNIHGDNIAGYYKNIFYHHKIINSKNFQLKNIFNDKNPEINFFPLEKSQTKVNMNNKCKICESQLDYSKKTIFCIFCKNFSIRNYVAINLDKYMIINSLFLSELAKIITKISFEI